MNIKKGDMWDAGVATVSVVAAVVAGSTTVGLVVAVASGGYYLYDLISDYCGS